MFILARDRALIALAGADRTSFLQGIVSNDVEKATEERAIYAAFLTPQGKYLHDIFIAGAGRPAADRLRSLAARPISCAASASTSCAPR